MSRLGTIVALLLALAVLAAACGPESAGPARGVQESQLAPDFTLDSLAGGELSLAYYRGSVVLLNFWATWCPPCELEMPDIEQAHRTYRDRGLVVLGINAQESPDVVQAYVDRMGLTFPILLDTRGQVQAQYRGRGLPMTLILDRDGVIQARHLGYLSAAALAQYLARVGLE